MRRALYDNPDVAQRAIVLMLLRGDHAKQWSRAELEVELHDVEPLAICDALVALNAGGVAHVTGEQVCAARCTLHLNALGMIAL